MKAAINKRTNSEISIQAIPPLIRVVYCTIYKDWMFYKVRL